jgi:hypothetical protein
VTRKEFLQSLAGVAATTVVAPASSIPSTMPGSREDSQLATNNKETPSIPSVFEVGNRRITRRFESNGRCAFTTDLKARITMQVTSSEFALVVRTSARQILLTPFNACPANVNVVALPERVELMWSANAPALDIHVIYQTDGQKPRILKWLEATNHSDQTVRIVRATVESLEVSAGGEPLRGGVGQPVVLRNEFFLPIILTPWSHQGRLGRASVLFWEQPAKMNPLKMPFIAIWPTSQAVGPSSSPSTTTGVPTMSWGLWSNRN